MRVKNLLVGFLAVFAIGAAVPSVAQAVSTSQVQSMAASYSHSQCVRYTGCSSEQRVSTYSWSSGYIGVDQNWQITSKFLTRYYGWVCTIFNYSDLYARSDTSSAYYWDC